MAGCNRKYEKKWKVCFFSHFSIQTSTRCKRQISWIFKPTEISSSPSATCGSFYMEMLCFIWLVMNLLFSINWLWSCDLCVKMHQLSLGIIWIWAEIGLQMLRCSHSVERRLQSSPGGIITRSHRWYSVGNTISLVQGTASSHSIWPQTFSVAQCNHYWHVQYSLCHCIPLSPSSPVPASLKLLPIISHAGEDAAAVFSCRKPPECNQLSHLLANQSVKTQLKTWQDS